MRPRRSLSLLSVAVLGTGHSAPSLSVSTEAGICDVGREKNAFILVRVPNSMRVKMCYSHVDLWAGQK